MRDGHIQIERERRGRKRKVRETVVQREFESAININTQMDKNTR